MDFPITPPPSTPEQDELRSLVRGFLGKHAVNTRAPGSLDTALWRRFAGELGLTGLAVDESFGASWAETAIVLEEAGRALLALPYLSTVVAGPLLPPTDRAAIAAGDAIAVLALDGSVMADGPSHRLDGTTPFVMDADVATIAVVAAGDALYSVALTDVGREAGASLDLSRPGAVLRFAGTPATRLTASPDQARDRLHLALAAEALGTGIASLESTVEYLRTRRQFGVALASFQSLRHRVADLAVGLEAAVSTTWYAGQAPAEELPLLAPMAKLVAADAAYAMTAESIQLHGGIGFTWEHDAHRYFKRATVTRLTHGDPVGLRRLIAARR